MHLLIVLDVLTNEVAIIDAFNEELDAQNNMLDKITELTEDKDSIYECVMVNKTKCNIYSRQIGWTYSSKVLEKIVTLHNVDRYEIMEVEKI